MIQFSDVVFIYNLTNDTELVPCITNKKENDGCSLIVGEGGIRTHVWSPISAFQADALGLYATSPNCYEWYTPNLASEL